MSNREILFRGKYVYDGEWVYGDYVQDFDMDIFEIVGFRYIPTDDGELRKPFSEVVDPETVGQSTARKDIDGNRIFEDDILRFTLYGHAYTGVVTYKKGAFLVALTEPLKYSFCMTATVSLDEATRYGAVVIGNIHDNPELLEVESDGTER